MGPASSASRPATTRPRSTAGSRRYGRPSCCGSSSPTAVAGALGGLGVLGDQVLSAADRHHAVPLVKLLQEIPIPQHGAVDPAVGALHLGDGDGAMPADELGGGGHLEPI